MELVPTIVHPDRRTRGFSEPIGPQLQPNDARVYHLGQTALGGQTSTNLTCRVNDSD